MLNIKGHGGNTVPDSCGGHSKRATLSAACGYINGACPDWDEAAETAFGSFGYFFEDAPNMPGGEEQTELLTQLALAMAEDPSSEDDNSTIPPVFTYLGQFIDHDITAGTDRNAGVSDIDVKTVNELPRQKVIKEVANLRHGSLNLDSLYGGGPAQGEFAKIYDNALRYPKDRAKLWAGTSVPVPRRSVVPPADPAEDLLRLGRVLQKNIKGFTEADLRQYPRELVERFFHENDDGSLGDIIPQQAIIGDARNDENLFIAQLHLAFIRLHNKIVDVAHRHGGPVHDKDQLFEWARRQVQFTYQWLVMHAYLPTICDKSVVADVIGTNASVYQTFLTSPVASPAPTMRLPLEFSVAAFRFGHSMVRDAYDWNEFFGRPEPARPENMETAPFNLLFAFTGNGSNPMFGNPRLPSDWVADWKRLALPAGAFKNRAARKLDSKVALPLKTMRNEPGGTHQPMKDLMIRNLLRGLRLNVPSAQDCIDGFRKKGVDIKPLSKADLVSGKTGQVIDGSPLEHKTPLWFYVLKEAEVQGKGEHLGELGSRLVAETLAGLIMHDPNSYWHQPGSDRGRWHPNDGAQPNNEAITDIPAMLRAAGLL